MLRRIKVWDLPTRLFHWLLVALLIALWVTAEWGMDVRDHHMRLGNILLALLVFRLVWGVIGTRYARFTGFVFSPWAALAHLRGLLQRKPSGYIGHNPLGTWSVIALLLLLSAQVVSGLFASDDILYSGPLRSLVSRDTSELMTWLHYLVFYWLLLPVIALHLLAILYYRLVKRESLVWPMVCGKKAVDADRAAELEAPMAGWWWRAAIAIAIAGAVVWAVNTRF